MKDLTNLKTFIIDSKNPIEIDDAISLEISNNVIKTDYGKGIKLTTQATSEIRNNTLISNSGDYGIHVSNYASPVIRNNIIQGFQKGIYDDTYNLNITYNTLWDIGIETCSHTLNMYGDNWWGWDGAAVDITLNGVVIVSGATTNNSSSSISFDANNGDDIGLTWVSSGWSNSAISWEITDPFGNIITSGVYGDPGNCLGVCPNEPELFSGAGMPPLIGQFIAQNLNGDTADIYRNINMNPMFASPETGDYTLSVVSPCVNAGDNNLLDPDGSISDIGANIYSAQILLGDTNYDGTLNVLDVIMLVNIILYDGECANWLQNCPEDLNQDQTLNILDIVELVNIILN